MVDDALVLEALSEVTGPSGEDIVAEGRVRSLVVQEGRVGFAIAARPDERAVMEEIRAKAEAAVAALAGVERVLAAVVADEDMPAQGAPAGEPRDGGLAGRARRLAGRFSRRQESAPARPAPRLHPGGAAQKRGPAPGPAPQRTPAGAPGAGPSRPRPGPVEGIRRVIAVGSGKGGVGKSTVSVNLAVSLAAMGWRVGLLDADIFGPSVPMLLGAVDHKPRTEGEKLVPLEAFGISAMSIGFLVAPEKAVVWRGPMVTGALGQLMRDTLWGELDCLLIDMPPGTGDIQLSLAQQTPLTGAVVVTTPQDLALIDVRKAAQMFAAVNVPILGVVENMATFVCPKCGTETAIFGHGGGAREAEVRRVPFLGGVPLTLAIREASDAGRPVAAGGEGPEAEAYGAIAANLASVLGRVSEKPFPAIVFE